MAKTIVFANQKGGVGKTTTVVSVGSYLALAGKKTLLIDFDPQSNLSSAVGYNKVVSGIYDVLLHGASIINMIKTTVQENLYIVPSNMHLAVVNGELISRAEREFYLKKILATIQDKFDFILIDCPPSLDLLTINGIAAANYIIVPLQSEYFAAMGFLNMLFNTITRIQKNLNSELKLLGIVFTMFDGRTKLGIEVIEKIRAAIKNNKFFFKTVIPRNVKLAEAPSHGLPIHLYDPSSIGALRYKALAAEVLERV